MFRKYSLSLKIRKGGKEREREGERKGEGREEGKREERNKAQGGGGRIEYLIVSRGYPKETAFFLILCLSYIS